MDGLIPNHAPGSAFPTAEIDHLAIAPFGVFVAETKHWTGVVTHGETDDTVTLTTIDGQRFVRTSPIKQNSTKVRFLRKLLPPRLCIVEGLGVFSA
ncbi:nuclease-related domain-containing protein [Paraburkholderia sp. BR10954]|uniref:nuclease-related domain-containing protein n=1 Tax=Paraburkholderia sp. BR10954 TaxID=3236995 RepID=UPI0034D23A52